MNIEAARRHLAFLADKIEHLGHPVVIAELLRPEIEAREKADGAYIKAHAEARKFLDDLHEAWVKEKQPKVQEEGKPPPAKPREALPFLQDHLASKKP